MKKYLYKIIFSLFLYGSCFAISLGFKAPSKIFLPGEIFTNNIVINYDSVDPIPTAVFLNVEWNGETIDIRTALWNKVDFKFTDYTYFNTYSNIYSNTFLYSSSQPKEQSWIANTNLSIVKLVCAVVGHAFCNFEFNYETNDVPYPTAVIGNNCNDIIGDTNIYYDGFDVFPVITRAAAGYVLSSKIDDSNIAMICSKTNLILKLEISRFGNPLPYEHIRAMVDYDETVVECTSAVLDVPSWLKNVNFTIVTTNIICDSSNGTITNNEPTGTIIFEADSPCTNYAGVVAKINFKPIDYEETEFEFDEVDTYVKRNNVNLLGLVNEEDDGMENSIVYVLPAKNMRFVLKPVESIGTIYDMSKANLYLTSFFGNYIDELNFSFCYDTNFVSFSENCDFNFKLNDELTNNATCFFYTELLTNSSLPYNHVGNVLVLFDSIITNQKDGSLFIGELSWTNNSIGNANFFINVNDSSIKNNDRDLIDDESQQTEFPVTFSVINFDEYSDYFDVIKLIPDGLTNYVMQPGNTIKINICKIGVKGEESSGQVVWKYDKEKFKPVSFSNNIWTNEIAIENGALTTSVFGINSDFYTMDYTTIFGAIEFQAIKSGQSYLQPIYELSHVTNFFGDDSIGSFYSTNDGIMGCTIVCKQPDKIFMKLTPQKALFAGKNSDFLLELLNPLMLRWTDLRVEVEFDNEELNITNAAWNLVITSKFPQLIVQTNYIEKTIKIKNNSSQSTTTTETATAVFQLSSPIPILTDTKQVLATFNGTPLSDEINYDFYFNSSNQFNDLTYVKRYNYNLLNENNILNQDRWLVSPSGVKIWIESEMETRPVIQTIKKMFVHIDNPNNMMFNHITLAWTYDANDFEIMSAETVGSITGSVWFDNHDDGEGHLYADLYLQKPVSFSELKVLNFSILPKLTDVLEMDLDSIEIAYTNEIEAGVWQNNLNLLETLDDDVFDNCQEWARGPELTRHPLLYIEDIYDLIADETILELNDSGTGLEVYKNDVNYKWWAVGNTNIIINFNNESMTAKIMGKSNWTGRETFWIYCEDLNNKLISKDSIQIDVNDPHYSWDDFSVYTTREEYYTITDYIFTDVKFVIKNPPEKFDIYAYIINDENITNQVPLNLIGTHGNLIWTTPATPGIYHGYILATNCYNPIENTFATFQIEVVDGYSNTESDGDRFMVLYNKTPITLQTPTKIIVNTGTDNDTLKIKVWKNKEHGDGIVKFDEIVANHGFKKISLLGSVNLIDTAGPIGSLTVKKGVVGQIIVRRGGINNVKIATGWDNYYQSFFDAGLVEGIDAYGDIGTIKIIGGSIGDNYYPAVILSRYGNIGNIVTRMKKRVYYDGIPVLDNKYIEVAGENGANIFASIYAPNGSIGSIIAVGGQIGTEILDNTTEIHSSGEINKIIAKSKKGDEETLGGSILCDIYAKNDIKLIKSIGGNIAGSLDIMDTDGELDEYELMTCPIIIKAGNINKILSVGKKYRFKDGYSKDDVWNELHGGNISACINSKDTLKLIKSKAGTMCVNIETQNEISVIKAKAINFKEYWDSSKQKLGGNLIYSSIMPNVKYRSDNTLDYNSFVGFMKFSGVVKESWIGTRGPYEPKKFKLYHMENTDIWVDGKKVN